MYAIQNRQYLSVIATTGADIHCAVTYRDSGLGRGRTRTKLTAITSASATPGTAILGAATAQAGGPDSAQASFEVTNISIRNVDTSSQTVTVCIVEVDDAGTQTVYQLYKETIATAQELVFEENAGWSLATHNVLGIWNTMTVAVDVTNSTTVLADVTGLTFPVIAASVYEFRAVIAYTAAATTTGALWTTNGPAITSLSCNSRCTVTATTEATNYITAHGAGTVSSDSLTVGNVAVVTGFFKPSADGTFAIQFKSEVGASAIVALAGSTLMVRRTL